MVSEVLRLVICKDHALSVLDIDNCPSVFEYGFQLVGYKSGRPLEDVRQRQLHERAGDLLYLSGRFVEASERFSTAADASHDLVAARRHRKWAHTLVASQQIPAANERIALPQTILRAISPESRSEQWLREYFATEVEWLWLLYLQSRTDEMRSAAARLASDLAAHGTRSESGRYHRSLALLELRAADFRADTEIVRLAATAHAELADDADRTAACFAGFTHAFTVLWSGDDTTAMRLLRNVLEEARRIGDGERHLLCLTYLAVTARFGGDVDGTRAFATAGAVAAHTAGAQLYEGVNEANLAWADWRAGHDTADRTQQRLAQAVAHIRVVPSYPFLWLATLVEIALLVDAGDLTTVGELCASLLMPPMQRLPDSLAGPLARAAASPSPESRRAVVAAAETTGHL